MSIGHTCPALLEEGTRHGYDLKRAFGEHVAAGRPLPYGQGYATLCGT